MAKLVVVYDGDCAFCSSSARWADSRFAADIECFPYQLLDLSKYGLTKSSCADALQVVTSTNEIFSGHRAVQQILLVAPWPWRGIGLLVSLPGIRSLAKVGYRWVSKNRFRLPGGTPSCNLTE